MRKIYNLYYQNRGLLWNSSFVKFILAGLVSVLLEMSILISLVEVFKVNYLLANGIAFIVTNSFNYCLSRYWVFERSGRTIKVELTLFFLATSVGLLINQLVMFGLVDHYHINYKISKLAAIIVVVGWNFCTRKFLVFSTSLKPQNA